MAGYIGSTAAVTQVDGYTKTEADGRYVEGDDTLYVDQANNRVGVGTSNPIADFSLVDSSTGSGMEFQPEVTTDTNRLTNYDRGDSAYKKFRLDASEQQFYIGGSEKAKLDSSGNLMVGKSALGYTTNGHEIKATGELIVSRSGTPVAINRNSSDGALINFYKDGTNIGSLNSRGGNGLIVNSLNGYDLALSVNSTDLYYCGTNAIYPSVDNTRDLGSGGYRYDDIYATNGSIQTSDRNEKQDIEELTDAEKRVAVAAKGLLRKFRWKSAVAKKGEAARTHFGIIAQDLQAAFAAEGLDASDYAMFISGTWWEHQVEVPAVEADEENGIEAADAYTRTDTYDTAEEAQEGATQKTRLGVRYSELLAFIIGAL